MIWTTRTASIRDVDRLHDLIERANRGDSARAGWTHEADLLDGPRIARADLAGALGNPGQRIIIAESEGALVGSVRLMRADANSCALGLLAVEPRLQGKGIGRMLIARAEQEAAETFRAGRMEMRVLKQRPELIAYYARRGYRPTGAERPFPLDDPSVGLPRTRELVFIVLEKNLSPPH